MNSTVLEGIKNIIFDLGNVIIELDIEASNQAFEALLGRQKDKFFDHLQSIGVFQDYEKGKISSAVFVDYLKELTDKNITSRQIESAWNAMLLDIPKSRYTLLTTLKQQYRTFCLSNTNQLHADFIHDQLEEKIGMKRLDPFFEKVYLSHEIGMRKPDQEIFEFVLSQNNLEPEETLFIDDTIGHLKGAASLGIKTLHLKAPDVIENYF